MAIDFGTKRVGIAVTDPLKMIATGLTTVHASEVMVFLADYFLKEEVEAVVVGRPVSLKNEATHGTVHSDDFVKAFVKKFPSKKIERADERFTSLLAKRTMLEAGLNKKKRQDKELVDEISAVLILQQYLESLNNNKT